MGKYDIMLGEAPSEIVDISYVGIPMGPVNGNTELGYLLADTTALLESKKEDASFYVGGAGMDGIIFNPFAFPNS